MRSILELEGLRLSGFGMTVEAAASSGIGQSPAGFAFETACVQQTIPADESPDQMHPRVALTIPATRHLVDSPGITVMTHEVAQTCRMIYFAEHRTDASRPSRP